MASQDLGRLPPSIAISGLKPNFKERSVPCFTPSPTKTQHPTSAVEIQTALNEISRDDVGVNENSNLAANKSDDSTSSPAASTTLTTPTAPSVVPPAAPNPKNCNGFSSDLISVEDLTKHEWLVWYRKGSGDPWLEQNRTRIVPTVRFLTDPSQILLRVDGTSWDEHIVQWRYIFLDGYDEYSFIRISNFPTLQVVKCMRTGAFFLRSNWMLLTSFQASFEEIDGLDKALEAMSETDSWERFNIDESTILNHGHIVPDAPQVVMGLAFSLPKTQRMRVYLPCT